MKKPSPLMFLKTDFWKHKPPLTCFTNCIFLEPPPAHLDFLTLTWRRKSSSFAGNSINCGCWNVLDLNVRAPSVTSQKACYKHWMFLAGIISSVFFKSSTTNSHVRPVNLVPSSWPTPWPPHLWEQAFHKCGVRNVPEAGNMLVKGHDI